MEIIAITVSTNYTEFLELCLKQNSNFFKKWYIITNPNDFLTQELCKNYSNVEVLLYDFSTPCIRKEKSKEQTFFNKGGAIRMAQERAYVCFPNHCYLIIDSDICLNEDFLQQINQFNIEDNSIYGASRYLYLTVNDYITKRPPIFWKRKLTKKIIGYFQMYKSAFFYKDSFDCSMCDMNFAKLFTNRILLPFNVNHIGNIIENWKGRNVN